jgi:hypothetical protein
MVNGRALSLATLPIVLRISSRFVAVGTPDVTAVGRYEGLHEGQGVGTNVGSDVGGPDGAHVGIGVGLNVGTNVGSDVGEPDGAHVGIGVGLDVGSALGSGNGGKVGELVGTEIPPTRCQLRIIKSTSVGKKPFRIILIFLLFIISQDQQKNSVAALPTRRPGKSK